MAALHTTPNAVIAVLNAVTETGRGAYFSGPITLIVVTNHLVDLHVQGNGEYDIHT